MKNKTFLFHDYETYGLNTKKTRVSQFAAIRTDEDFNIIAEKEYDLMSVPPIDFIPSPEACLVTGITPHSITKNNIPHLNDYQLFSKVFEIFNEPGTCSLGYNSVNFDDEVTRNGFYRNLFPPYTREFKSDCSRFDLLNIVREFAFLYPDDIKVPKDENGSPVFKLDTIAPLNGFKEDSYHNAFTDVKATIFLAKLIKEKQPEYWNLKINTYKKQDVIKYLNNNRNNPLIYTHSTNGGKSDFVEPVFIVAHAYPDANSYIGVKLSDLNSIKNILEIPLDEIKSKLYLKNEELEEEGLTRLPFVKITANKLPVITSYLNEADKINIKKINKPLSEINQNLSFIKENIERFRKSAMAAFKNEGFNNDNKNSDLMIYDGFMSTNDESIANEFRKNINNKIFKPYITENLFSSEKLNDLARKVIYRNFSEEIISDPELKDYYFSFLKRSHEVIKNGFDSSYNYTEEELKNENFMKNDKMVEFNLQEMREIIPELIERYKDDPEKSQIINDFRASLNDLISEYKNKNALLTSDQVVKKEEKKKSYNRPGI